MTLMGVQDLWKLFSSYCLKVTPPTHWDHVWWAMANVVHFENAVATPIAWPVNEPTHALENQDFGLLID
jgi:hypothetical protein